MYQSLAESQDHFIFFKKNLLMPYLTNRRSILSINSFEKQFPVKEIEMIDTWSN